MPAPKGPARRHDLRGMPAADRAMWIRLYEGSRIDDLPWAFREPFPPLERAVAAGTLPSPGPILDVGCGTGTNTYWLASQGFQVTGIDIAPGAIAAAEARRVASVVNPAVREDDVLASALPKGRFSGAVDVGCFQTLPPQTRGAYAEGVSRLLSPDAPLLLFWVAREELGAWGPPHRLSVLEVVDPFERWFLVDRVEFRARTARLSSEVRRTRRPLVALAGYTARLLRRRTVQPPPR